MKVKLSLLIVVLVFSLLLQACSSVPELVTSGMDVAEPVYGDVVPLLKGAANFVFTKAAGGYGTVLEKDGNLVLEYTFKWGGYAFSILKKGTLESVASLEAVGIQAQHVSQATWNDFHQWLLNNGWKEIKVPYVGISAGTIAANLRAMGIQVTGWLSEMRPTILVVPAGSIMPNSDPIFEGFEEYKE